MDKHVNFMYFMQRMHSAKLTGHVAVVDAYGTCVSMCMFIPCVLEMLCGAVKHNTNV